MAVHLLNMSLGLFSWGKPEQPVSADILQREGPCRYPTRPRVYIQSTSQHSATFWSILRQLLTLGAPRGDIRGQLIKSQSYRKFFKIFNLTFSTDNVFQWFFNDPNKYYIGGTTLPLPVFYQKSSSVKGCLPSKVVFRQRSSSVKGCLPSKVVFRQRSSSVKGRLPSKVVFRQRSSSVKGCLPS